jgi:DNA invertase Pin-like site-specific DNA recombinase
MVTEMTQHTRFISYLRVSTSRQSISGLGLEAQRQMIKTHMSLIEGSELIKEYVEVESGKNNSRNELQKAIDSCKVYGNCKLIVSRVDRLSRNSSFLMHILDSGLDVTFCDYPTSNRMTISIMAVMAQEEAKLISTRIKESLKVARDQRGTKLGTNNLSESGSILGRKNSSKIRANLANEHAKNVSPIIIQIRNEGITTYRGISERLNDLGVRTRRGGRYYPSSVMNVIKRIDALTIR